MAPDGVTIRSVMEQIRQWFKVRFGDDRPSGDGLPDPELAAFDRGLGTLRVDGVLKGHLASVRTKLGFPPDQWQVWFVIVWADGSKEPPFEDYGPGWHVVRELNAGHLNHSVPSTHRTREFLGHSMHIFDSGEPQLYDFAWLPPDEAVSMWHELGLADTEF